MSANWLGTSLFLSTKQGKFILQALPVEAQYAPVYTLSSLDYNRDGKPDLLLAGNQNQARLRFGKADANYGVLLQGDGQGQFTYIPQTKSGLQMKGDVRSVLHLNNTLLLGINQQPVKAYNWK